MQPTGASRTEIDVQDNSTLTNTAQKGKVIFLGRTERGKVGKAYEVGTSDEYREKLGGYLSDDDFPLYAIRALDGGARLVVIPVGKYTDPTSPATLSGVKASYSLTQGSSAAAGATSIADINAVAITNSGTLALYAQRPGQSDLLLGTTTTLTNSDTLASVATAAAAAVNANTGTTQYTASANTTSGEVTVTAPASLGAWGRRMSLKIVDATGGITFANLYPQFTGGADALSGGTMTIAAYERGTAYNNVQLVVSPSISNNVNTYDITISLLNSSLTPEVIRDVPKLASDAGFAAKINSLVLNSQLISALTFSPSLVLQPGSYTLISGTNGSVMSPADYIGDSLGGTNIFAADAVLDATKICIPAIADPAVALALANYVDQRQDMIALHRTPLGITPARVLDYRNGTGTYNHVAINSWRNVMFTGGLEVVDPVSGGSRVISEIADVAAAMSRKDSNYHEWFSFAGTTRGVIRNALNVGFNMLSKSLGTTADAFDAAGIIPVVKGVKDGASIIYIKGDNTLYRPNTLLKKSNVAELLVYMHRTLSQMVGDDFEPNDVESWKSIYRRIQPFMESLKTERAIWDYIYQGDQDVATVQQAVINRPTGGGSTVDSGMYKIKLGIQPKVNMKYIWITIGVYNSNFNFAEITVD